MVNIAQMEVTKRIVGEETTEPELFGQSTGYVTMVIHHRSKAKKIKKPRTADIKKAVPQKGTQPSYSCLSVELRQ